MHSSFSERWRSGWVAVAALIFLACVLGGASRENALPLAILEFAAVPALFWFAWRLFASDRWPRYRGALQILAVVAALPLLQLVPLPPGIWTNLPGRSDELEAYRLIHVAPPWRPISLSPATTWAAFLALIPPAAVLLGALRLDARRQLELVLLLGVVVLANLVLGAAQLAGGWTSPFYLYPDNTNLDSAVGFFANRNHLADLLLISLPLGAGAAAALAGLLGPLRRERIYWGLGLFVFVAMVGIGVVRSRAGLVLLPLAMGGAALLLARAVRSRPRHALALAGSGVLAAVLVVSLGLSPLLDRFQSSGAPEGRLEAWPRVFAVGSAHLPVGAGFGVFDPVYRAAEKLTELTPVYLNHAHNEYLEVFVEAGWPGVAGLVLILILVARLAAPVWRDRSPEALLARGASLALLLVALHSAVDYPLRTEAIAAVAALCVAILARQARQSPSPAPG